MTNKVLETFWLHHPGSQLHCDVTKSGRDTYRIVAALLDENGNLIAELAHIGSGELNALKEEAFEKLALEVEHTLEE